MCPDFENKKIDTIWGNIQLDNMQICIAKYAKYAFLSINMQGLTLKGAIILIDAFLCTKAKSKNV